MPDFDIDFCMDGRDRVIDYVARPLRPRARLADHHLRHDGGEGRGARRRRACSACRYGFVDRIAKLIPFELGITLDDALDEGAGAAAALRDRGGGARPHRPGAARSKAWRATPARTPAAW